MNLNVGVEQKNKKVKKRLLNIVALNVFAIFSVIILCISNATWLQLANLLILYICLFFSINSPTVLNPYLAFLSVPLSVVLYNLRISPEFLTPINTSTGFIIIISNLFFILGLLFSGRQNDAKASSFCTITNKNLYLILSIGLLPTFIQVILGSNLILSGQLLKAKEYAAIPVISLFIIFKYFALVMAYFRKNKKSIFFVNVLIVLSILLNFSKAEFIWCIVVNVFAMAKLGYFSNKRKGLLFVLAIICASLLILVFNIYNYFRSLELYGAGIDSVSRFFERGAIASNIPKMLALPLLYLITPWTNLNYMIQTNSQFTFGLWFFKPIISLCQLDSLYGFSNIYQLIPYKIVFNTFTYITVIYKDFGVPGCILVPFLLGLYISKLYKMYLNDNSPYITTIYAFNFYAVTQMFFSNHFFQQSYPFIVLIMGILLGHIQKRKRRLC